MPALNMKLDNVQAQEALDPLPPNYYTAQITESEVKEADSGVTYLKLKWQVLDEGEFKGRHVWENISLSNPRGKSYEAGKSPVEIGARKIKTIAICGHHPNPNYIRSSEELHGLPMLIKVAVRQTEGYSPQNDVKGYKQLSSDNQQQPQNITNTQTTQNNSQSQQTNTNPPPQTKKQPWMP